MLELKVRLHVPAGVEPQQYQSEYRASTAILSERLAGILTVAPTQYSIVNDTGPEKTAERSFYAESIDVFYQIFEIIDDWISEEYVAYRIANNITRDVQIINQSTGAVLLDWTVIPETKGPESVAWIHEHIVI